MVWSYLYSGRDQEAWQGSPICGPQADFDRIRSAILDARARGIRREVDGVSSDNRGGYKKQVTIYDSANQFVTMSTLINGAAKAGNERVVNDLAAGVNRSMVGSASLAENQGDATR